MPRPPRKTVTPESIRDKRIIPSALSCEGRNLFSAMSHLNIAAASVAVAKCGFEEGSELEGIISQVELELRMLTSEIHATGLELYGKHWPR